MQDAVILTTVFIAGAGLFAQCLANLKSRRAEFLAFPIALFLLMPYPFWAGFAVFNVDYQLLGIMIVLGVPSAWLSLQFFLYEWHRREGKPIAVEDKLAVVIFATGFGLFGVSMLTSDPVAATGLTAAYFTTSLMVYSFPVKIWRVARGDESLEGVKWATLIVLAVLYGAMIVHGQTRDILLLKYVYAFGEICVFMAIGYKLWADVGSRKIALAASQETVQPVRDSSKQ